MKKYVTFLVLAALATSSFALADDNNRGGRDRDGRGRDRDGRDRDGRDRDGRGGRRGRHYRANEIRQEIAQLLVVSEAAYQSTLRNDWHRGGNNSDEFLLVWGGVLALQQTSTTVFDEDHDQFEEAVDAVIVQLSRADATLRGRSYLASQVNQMRDSLNRIKQLMVPAPPPAPVVNPPTVRVTDCRLRGNFLRPDLSVGAVVTVQTFKVRLFISETAQWVIFRA